MRYAPALVLLVAFMALAGAMTSGAILPFDVAARRLVHCFSLADLTALAQFLSFVGSALVWLPAALIATGSLWLLQRRKPARAIIVTMLGAILLDNGPKFLFHRARPEVFFGVSPDTYSFPSGHALFATCFYGVLAAVLTTECENALLRKVLWGAAVLMILGIGWSRIYLGVHFPSDVLAGYLVGASWLAALRGTGHLTADGGRPGDDAGRGNARDA